VDLRTLAGMGGLTAALVIGSGAGLLPALRAECLSPSQRSGPT